MAQEEKKKKLQQRKNRIMLDEIRIKERERKMRTRKMIEIGSLAMKAGIDYLPSNTIYGAFLSLIDQLNIQGKEIQQAWTDAGSKVFEKTPE